MLVIDLEIPAVGSVALLGELGAAKARPQPRTIVLATSAQVALATELMQLGANDVLEKPVTASQLLASITKVLCETVENGCDPEPARRNAAIAKVGSRA